MKKFIFLFLLLILSLAFKNETVNTFPLFGKTIVIDIGHGSVDPGAVSNGEYEKDYNLDFGNILSNTLNRYGANVIMTRVGDYDLSDPNAKNRKRSDFNNRIKIIDESNADMYISLHMNYLSDNRYYGSQVFYSDVNDDNIVIAKVIQEKFNNYFSSDRDTKNIGDDKYMFKNINTRGVLIEYGFISSNIDKKNLKSNKYKNDLAKVISDGIIKYFS